MRYIIALGLIVVFLTGCTITGRIVEEVEEQHTQEEKDLENLQKAVTEKDISYCYNLQSQPVREVCFINLAKEIGDASICDNLLGKSLRDSCKAGIQR